MPNYCQQFDATIVSILSSHNFFQTLTTLVRTLLVFQGYSIIPHCSSPQWFPRHGLPHYLLCLKVLLSCFESLPSAPFLSHLSDLSKTSSHCRSAFLDFALSLSLFVSLVTCFKTETYCPITFFRIHVSHISLGPFQHVLHLPEDQSLRHISQHPTSWSIASKSTLPGTNVSRATVSGIN